MSENETQAELAKRARRHAAMDSRLKFYGARQTEEDLNRATRQIGLMVFFYFILGVFINIVDPEYLVAAWLFTAALGAAVYFTRKSRRPVVNVYTVVFGVCVVGCLLGFALSRGWSI